MNFTFDLEILFKLLLSVLIGLLIGRERKKHDKSGGSRTVGLICLGATLMGILNLKLMELSNYSDLTRIDIARIPAYLLVAIGFLGSGLITKVKMQVEGLTSASTLFAIVPVGVCIGMGMYDIGVAASILILGILELKYIKRR